jgi:hypothetical protein
MWSGASLDPPGDLGRVHDLYPGRQVRQQLQRGEAVGHHDIRRPQPAQPGDSDQARIPGSAAHD